MKSENNFSDTIPAKDKDPLAGKLPVRFLNKYECYNAREIAWLPEKTAKALCEGARPAAELYVEEKKETQISLQKKEDIQPKKKTHKKGSRK